LDLPATSTETTGYLNSLYCESLSEFGRPRLLPECEGWILERRIPNASEFDAMGCYPMFACSDWSKLQVDLKSIGESLVSLSVVTDPFGEYDLHSLRDCFPEVASPFKEHFVVDLSHDPISFVHPHHRRNARKALQEMRVELCENPLAHLDDWVNLYATLIARHEIRGLTTFSRASFEKQLRVPGIVMVRAVRDAATLGILLWYRQNGRAYYHLGAYSPLGYDLKAASALFSFSLEYFAKQKIDWLNLGAGAGAGTSAESGLSRFKRGWSTGTKTAYFCGRVFAARKYEELARAGKASGTNYFPAYRAGEFS